MRTSRADYLTGDLSKPYKVDLDIPATVYVQEGFRELSKITSPFWVVAIFIGRKAKPACFHSFTNEEAAKNYAELGLGQLREQYSERIKAKEKRKAFKHSLKVGDILTSSWGYDQTNVNFYRVTKVLGKFVELEEVSSKMVAQDSSMSGYVVPEFRTPNEPSLRHEGKTLRKLVQGTSADDMYVKIESFEFAYLWDGKEKFTSSWA